VQYTRNSKVSITFIDNKFSKKIKGYIMNKRIIVGSIAVFVLVSGVFVVMNNNDDSSSSPEATNNVAAQFETTTEQGIAQAEESVETNTTTEKIATSGSYVNYSSTAVAEATGTERVLFFHAEWCSTCKFFENSIKTTGVPEGITILQADFDNDTDLKARYGVNVQSTFVLIDENGEVVKTWPFASGLRSAQDLYDAVEEA
jgi:hypothetical protein